MQSQHRALNQFLNKALIDSKDTASRAKSRVPMDYKHTHEVDTSYELSPQGELQLPLRLQSVSRKRQRVRVTTDEKTGEELAKIVKTRVADIDIYNPRFAFDWRISVNIEMDCKMEKNFFVEVPGENGKAAERRKDRVSYKHLAYQIDLTQVVPAEVRQSCSYILFEPLTLKAACEQIRQIPRTGSRSLQC